MKNFLKMFEVCKISEKKVSVTNNSLVKGHTYRQWMVSLLANTTMVTYGLQSAWVSPMTKILQSEASPTGRPLTDNEISWIASIPCLVAIAGVFLYTYIADKYGRRAGVIAIAVPQALCWFIKLSSANVAILILSRVFCGLAAGGCYSLIPIYVKEITQDDIRGQTGSLLMLMQNLGILAIYLMGIYLDYFKILWIAMSGPILTIVFMMKAPESPAFLVKIGKSQDALATVAWLRGLDIDHVSMQSEINTIVNDKLYYDSLPKISFITIFKNKAWRRGVFLMSAIITTNGLNGCFAILIYAATILESSGVTVSAEVQTLSVPTLMIVAGFVSMACVERFGRKPLSAVTTFLISASMSGLGVIMLLQHQGILVPGWLPVTLMVTSVAAYSAGIGPVTYIMITEMFNFQIRAKVAGRISVICWITNFIQLGAYGPISSAFGTYTNFFYFGFISFVGFLLVIVFLPETKGKTVDEIEAKFKGK